MPQFMKRLAIVVLILMVIGSFVLGDMLKIVTFRSDSSYNFGAMFSGLLISIIVFGVLYSVGYALERLDLLAHHLLTLNQTGTSCLASLESSKDLPAICIPDDDNVSTVLEENPNLPPAGPIDEKEGHPVFAIDRSIPIIACPSCQMEQKSNRNVCFRCGAFFISNDQPDS